MKICTCTREGKRERDREEESQRWMTDSEGRHDCYITLVRFLGSVDETEQDNERGKTHKFSISLPRPRCFFFDHQPFPGG